MNKSDKGPSGAEAEAGSDLDAQVAVTSEYPDTDAASESEGDESEATDENSAEASEAGGDHDKKSQRKRDRRIRSLSRRLKQKEELAAQQAAELERLRAEVGKIAVSKPKPLREEFGSDEEWAESLVEWNKLKKAPVEPAKAPPPKGLTPDEVKRWADKALEKHGAEFDAALRRQVKFSDDMAAHVLSHPRGAEIYMALVNDEDALYELNSTDNAAELAEAFQEYADEALANAKASGGNGRVKSGKKVSRAPKPTPDAPKANTGPPKTDFSHLDDRNDLGHAELDAYMKHANRRDNVRKHGKPSRTGN